MSIQLCLLETGDTTIGDIREAIDPESNVSLGYIVTNPFTIEHVINNVVNSNKDLSTQNTSPEGASSIAFSIWGPLSRTRTFNFHKDFVRVIYEPSSYVTEKYVEIIQKWQEENTVSVEVDTAMTNLSTRMDLSEEADQVKENTSIETVN